MTKINLRGLVDMDGFIGACLVDSDHGVVLGLEKMSEALNVAVAATGNAEVVRAKRKVMESLGLDDKIEDILISLRHQYHIIRPLENNDAVFLYVALDRHKANLGMARLEIKNFAQSIRLN